MKHCKNEESLIKFQIIPRMIRTFWPEVIDFLVIFVAHLSDKRTVTPYIYYEKLRIHTASQRTTQNQINRVAEDYGR